MKKLILISLFILGLGLGSCSQVNPFHTDSYFISKYPECKTDGGQADFYNCVNKIVKEEGKTR
jgi:hypothetical protein